MAAAFAAATVVVLSVTAAAIMCSVILGLIIVQPWWNFLLLGNLGLVILLPRWQAMEIDLMMSTGIVGVASPYAAAVGIPPSHVCMIVVGTLS